MKKRSRRRFSAVFVFATTVFATVIVTIAQQQDLARTTLPPTATGPIQDATCDVEQLEEANDSQLYSILQELRQTAFFRTFAVDLDQRCPLSTWARGVSAKATPQEQESSEREEEEPPETQCASSGLPDLDPDAEPACSVQDDGNFLSASSETTSSQPPPVEEKEEKKDDSSSQVDDDFEEKEFECDGGSEELDDDAEPLCELTEDDFDKTSPLRDLISSALRSIAELAGWESDEQRQTFSWSKTTDPVVMSGSEAGDESCDGNLPDNFWLDMCSNIKVGDGVKLVNLALNPERNTGYNGTHIWRAIYEENCISVDGLATAPMCYEERVLYRLLSGLHSSTTLSIAKNYYPPSKRKGRVNWEPNPQYFMERFETHPENIRNLHFSYVVLLRALQKASSFLHGYEIRTGNIVEDETATILLKRLLDSTILRSCQSVFTAFDESLMFQDDDISEKKKDQVVLLQQNFKGVFHNISSILDCVQCQQCKLHGKMAMLGYGTALKILFTKNNLIGASLERNEIVALINTIAKFSESIKEVRELTHLYWDSKGEKELPSSSGDPNLSLVDVTVGLASSLASGGYISPDREAELVQLALARNPDLLVLAKHYGNDPQKFLHLSSTIGSFGAVDDEPDAVVVGSGLAGLAATLNILDRGGRVVVIEKEHRLGGNSNKASSGINACCPHNDTYGDHLETFRNDTIRSAGDAAQPALIDKLVGKSAEAVEWLKSRVDVDLSLLSQLGGHSHKRTHRPSNGMVGAQIIYGMQKEVKKFEKSGRVQILVDTRVTQLLTDENGRVVGVEYVNTANDEGPTELKAPNVILATGGFASDRSNGSYLSQYRPELMKMPATAGGFSTGDGITLATSLGAGTVDMDKVQIHPTGWVDPSDPSNPSKVLAAELMRGVGGVLLNKEGKRFCNELGTRAYVSDMMLSHDSHYAETKKWDATSEIPTFSLVLSSSAAEDGRKHVDLYSHKGLLKKLQGLSELADWMGVDVETVRSSLTQYQIDSKEGVDKWGKTVFRGVPKENLDEEVFYAGTVTPVLHYCMGGVTIDTEGNVLDKDGNIIPGLHAAGEVAGGVHGNNRLGGNSLLECTVYGTIVGKKIPIKTKKSIVAQPMQAEQHQAKQDREVTMEELKRHNTAQDCWTAVDGVVFDFTEFAEEHPAGAQSIIALAGKDGTEAFGAVHNTNMLDDFDAERIGILIDSNDGVYAKNSDDLRHVTEQELREHNDSDDCWVALHGEVYDLTDFDHPGGSHLIQNVAGKDGTDAFSQKHKPAKLALVQSAKVGALKT